MKYNDEHTAFVSNLKGTSVLDLLVCLLHLPIFIWILKYLQRNRKQRLMRDYLLLVLPMLLLVTLLADYIVWTLFVLLIAVVYMRRTKSKDIHKDSDINANTCNSNSNIDNSGKGEDLVEVDSSDSEDEGEKVTTPNGDQPVDRTQETSEKHNSEEDSGSIRKENDSDANSINHGSANAGINATSGVPTGGSPIKRESSPIYKQRLQSVSTDSCASSATDKVYSLSNSDSTKHKTHYPIDTTYLTYFKGTNVLLTCIAILAVDFRIFPRRFGKTELFGVSLMDVGVGIFIVSTAITSRYARGLKAGTGGSQKVPLDGDSLVPNWGSGKEAKDAASPSRIRRGFRQYFFSSYFMSQRLIVLGLGVGRFLTLKALDYHEHVSEYGIHWNFFVTLFVVWLVGDIIHYLIPRTYLENVAIGMLVMYQVLLSQTPLTEFVLQAPRVSLVSENKEGLFSLMGYIPLYLVAECMAARLFYRQIEFDNDDKSSEDTAVGDKILSMERQRFRNIMKSTAALWILYIINVLVVQPTSRRLANASYVNLVLALSLTLIGLLKMIDMDGKSNPTVGKFGVSCIPVKMTKDSMRSRSRSDLWTVTPNTKSLVTFHRCEIRTLQYASQHSLWVFLSSNLLTGAVNLMLKTIHVPAPEAFVILAVYSLLVACSAWVGEYFHNKNKEL